MPLYQRHDDQEWYQSREDQEWTVVPSRRRRRGNKQQCNPPRDHWQQQDTGPHPNNWVRSGPNLGHYDSYAAAVRENLDPNQWTPLGRAPENVDRRGAKRDNDRDLRGEAPACHHDSDDRVWTHHVVPPLRKPNRTPAPPDRDGNVIRVVGRKQRPATRWSPRPSFIRNRAPRRTS